MTEQEAEVLAARLTRIWSPTRFLINGLDEWNRFEYKGYWPDRTRLTVGILPEWGSFFFIQFWKNGRYCSSLACKSESGAIVVNAGTHREKMIAQWLPFFRRGCWLSGCPIQASAHEKAEWIQGFTHEEIELWNLKT